MISSIYENSSINPFNNYSIKSTMSAALGPGKFYGSSLPRPRFYKLNEERVDSPVPVLDPLLSWAEEAPRSKGGLNTTRRRHQGRMEGSVNTLRAERDDFPNKRKQCDVVDQIEQNVENDSSSLLSLSSPSPSGIISNTNLSTPPAPVAIKRRRRILSIVAADDDEREFEGGEKRKKCESEDCGESLTLSRQFPVRKLWDDFNSVASESVKTGAPVCRRTSRRLVKRRQQ